MEIKFLGTSAGEYYPGVWCDCVTCRKARQLGKKNIRQNTCLYISPDCLIDFPPEIVTQARVHGISLSSIEHLLVTHSHEDHFFPYLLQWRRGETSEETVPQLSQLGSRFGKLKLLHVYGSKKVTGLVRQKLGNKLDNYVLELHEVIESTEYDRGELCFIPLKANHLIEEPGLNYIIKQKDKFLLYALDTGWFLPGTYELIKKFKYDIIVIESTFGLGGGCDSHFDFTKLRKAYELFKKDNLLKDNYRFVATHFSPHHTPLHDEIVHEFKKEGITIAYDGMTLKI